MAHVPLEELQRRLQEARTKIEEGSQYTHYKSPDKPYIIKGFGILEASEEVAVIYENQAGVAFIRPLSEFLDIVTHENRQVPRFSKV
ncbi:MAG TPA: DUF1653 domain-containing protein [Candidatus Paceibacterota bacterium]|nr:DUF1653 domain-containing protein [Candidatus Paceibacterota bacterium]